MRNTDESNVLNVVNFIEFDLLQVVQTNLDDKLLVIYDFLDKEALEKLINETNQGRSLALKNEQSGSLLRDALNYYLGYLRSKRHPLSEKEKKNGKKKATPKECSAEAPINTAIAEPAIYDKLEGLKYESSVTRYERDRGNRKDCIAHYGYVCQICEMNFEKTYGEIGKDFIEVHHLHPVSQGERQVNPIEDLIPLCSNCHSMIHRQEDVSDWKGLKERYIQNKTNGNKNEEVHN